MEAKAIHQGGHSRDTGISSSQPMAVGHSRMKICVLGLWHLASVTAACLAAAGHLVTGLAFDSSAIDNLNRGIPPVQEPGLELLLRSAIENRSLAFTTSIDAAIDGVELIWVA